MKFMNMKRFASVAMAGALSLSLAVPAFAADNTTTITGAYTPITLRVTVPTTGTAIINPYGLPYQMGESTISGQQITTGAPLVLQNRSSVALGVTANVTGTASTGVTLEAAGTTADYSTVTDKKLHVVFEAFKADELTSLNVTDNDVLRPMFAELDSADAVLTGDVTTTAADATGDGLVLREADANGEVQSGGAAMFRLSGEAAKKASWEATDTFSATIAFTFEPTEYTKSAGTIALARTIGVGTADNTTADIQFTPALPTGVTAKTTTWASSDTTKMTIDQTSGLKVKAVAAGTATLTVTIEGSDGLTYTSSLDVTVGNNS